MKQLVSKNFEQSIERLQSVIKHHDLESPEASLVLPGLVEKKHAEMSQKLTGIYQRVQHVLIIGIGGSSLGAKSIMKFLGKKRKNYAELHFFETIDGEATYARLHSIISSVESADDLVVCEISKSGGTLETKLLSEYILDTLKKTLPGHTKRIVITGKGSDLEKQAHTRGDIIFHLE